ncbi:GTP-binding protein [Bacillus sp. JCM 19034]|uniref:CobW family GTP-binding protein n=1 Tax=Bacillus sp. JCM 19034 TaxID=1481928 RepID=UPI001E29D7D8|nr:GTP-binding protein [Bacillus sp. JCM 19034]
MKKLLRKEKNNDRRAAIMMNEVGQISVNSAIVPTITPLIELLDGCIFCSIQGELSVQLKSLLEQNNLDVIYIEATGLAHPLEIIHELAELSYVKAVITVVHVKQWLKQNMSIKLRKLMKEQLRFADVIVINQIDHFDATKYGEVELSIRSLNNKAKIMISKFASINSSFQELFSRKVDLSSNRKEFDADIHDQLHEHTLTLPFTKAVNRIRFTKWIKQHETFYIVQKAL